jgi:hypothetical protein
MQAKKKVRGGRNLPKDKIKFPVDKGELLVWEAQPYCTAPLLPCPTITLPRYYKITATTTTPTTTAGILLYCCITLTKLESIPSNSRLLL